MEQWQQWKQESKQHALPKKSIECFNHIRQTLDRQGEHNRTMIVAGDGGFTNRTVLKNLPHDTTFIGRIRKDAELFGLPSQSHARGRKRVYGDKLPTPDQIRTDDSPWTIVPAWAAGKVHNFQVKTMPVRWKPAGARDLRLVVIRPLAYRPQGATRVRYRDPAYLIVTDPNLDLQRVIQSYVWRWEIEVDFRDEKQLIGVGQAGVRTPAAVQLLPALIVAAYTMLHLACLRCTAGTGLLPLPKWRRSAPPTRLTTANALSLLRSAVWGKDLILPNFSRFANDDPANAKPSKLMHHFTTPIQSAIIYSSMC